VQPPFGFESVANIPGGFELVWMRRMINSPRTEQSTAVAVDANSTEDDESAIDIW
jgi:hypothetical protein